MKTSPHVCAFPSTRSGFLALLFGALSVAASTATAQGVHVVGGSHREPPSAMPHPPPRKPEALFRANCATCHGPLAAGDYSWIDPAYLAPSLQGAFPALIKGIARAGRVPVMPAFPVQEISDEELNLLANYIVALPGSYVAEPAYQATVQVLDEDPWFSPMQITISAGQTVRFLNAGATYHPVLDTTWLDTMGFDGESSGALASTGVYYRKFTQPGLTTLLCGAHHEMRCEIHVGESFTPPTYSVDSPMALPPVPGVGEVWVCAQSQDYPSKPKDGVIQVIDSSTWTVTHTIPVGNNPHGINFRGSGTEAIVTNWFDKNVSRVDATTYAATADCVAGATPAGIASDPGSQYWYVAIEASRYIQRFDQAATIYAPCGGGTLHVYAPFLSGYGPHGIAWANGKVVVANSMDSTFSIVNTTSLTETALLPAGMHPMGASANPAGTIGVCANHMGNSVSFYNLTSPAVIREIPLSDGALEAPFTPDATRVFASNGSGVTVIDVAKAVDPTNYPNPASAIVADIPTGKGARAIAFGAKSGGGTYAYVTNQFENYISVIDLATLTRVGDVPLSTTTTGKVSLAGATDTGASGIAVR